MDLYQLIIVLSRKVPGKAYLMENKINISASHVKSISRYLEKPYYKRLFKQANLLLFKVIRYKLH